MDLQVVPYFVELEGEDNDLFGNARDAAASAETAAAESDVDHRAAAADAETETAEARFLPGPIEPIQSQAGDHRAAGHIPFRNWCSVCVRSRGTVEQHRRRRDRRDICVFSFDHLHLDGSGRPLARGSTEA